MKNFSNIMKQAQQMQAKLMEAQSKVSEITVEGTSGGGMVTVALNGKNEMTRLDVDPKLLNPDDASMVCDLIVAAYNDAKKKLEEQISANMESVLPAGMKLPF